MILAMVNAIYAIVSREDSSSLAIFIDMFWTSCAFLSYTFFSLETFVIPMGTELSIFRLPCAYSSSFAFMPREVRRGLLRKRGKYFRPYPFSSPEPTILLVCGRDRELWLVPKQEVRESQTSDSSTVKKCTFTETAHISELARALDPCRRPEGSWALGTRMAHILVPLRVAQRCSISMKIGLYLGVKTCEAHE